MADFPNIFDRDADDLDARASALSPSRETRGRPSESRPSALDRAKGREPPRDDGFDRAKRETGPPAAINVGPPTVMPRTASDQAGLVDRATLMAPPPPRPEPTYPPPPANGPPPNYEQYGPNTIRTVDFPQGRAVPQQTPVNLPPGPGAQQGPPGFDLDYPGSGVARAPIAPGEVDRAGAAGLNVGDPHPPQQPAEPTLVQSDDEASFRPGPLPKKPGVTQPGKGGGAGGGGGAGAARGRLPLGNQSRTAAYDPTLDRADPRNVALTDDKGRVNPKQWERAQKGAIDPTTPGERTGEAAAKFTNQYTNALAGATQYMTDMFHQKKGDKNQGEGYAALTFKATGAPDPQVVNDVFKVVDPNNELVPKERMELATRAMHDWYTSRGDKENANKVAAEMLQHGNKQAQGHGNNALALFKKGDKQGAIGEIQKAYDWLPDGYKADVKGNNLVIADNKGKTLNNIPLDDKMIPNLATGLATGTLFWDVVQDRAGHKEKFGPPQAPPTQAIAAQPPGPGGAPATPAGPPAGAASGGAPPAGAAPPAPAAAPAAPAVPQTAGAPSAAPPPAPTPPAAAPAAAPAPPPPPATTAPPPPPVTPPGNRPAAPAPAAPGPASTQQAAPPPVTPQPPAMPPQGGGEPEQKPAIDASVPPPLQGPVQPSTTKRPIVEEPEKKPAGPATPSPTQASAEKTEPVVETKPPTVAQPVPAGEKKDPRTWSKDDPDSVPTVDGKPHVVRRATYPVSTDVRIANKNIQTLNKRYEQEQKDLIEDMKTPGLNLKDREVKSALDFRRNQIDKQHKADLAEQQAIIKQHNTESAKHDEQERKDLTYTPLKGQDRTEAKETVDTKLATYVKDPKHAFMKASPLRLYNTPEKWTDVREAVLAVKAINPKISTEKITDHVLTMMTHLEEGDKAKSQSANGHEGAKGSRFLVIGEDLARNPVVALGAGNSGIRLHIPKDTLNDIKRLKDESYRAKSTIDKEAEAKAKQDKADADKPSRFVPGRVTETIEEVKGVVKGAREKAEAEGRVMKPDAPTPEGLTPQQKLEADRKKRRQAADRANQAEP